MEEKKYLNIKKNAQNQSLWASEPMITTVIDVIFKMRVLSISAVIIYLEKNRKGEKQSLLPKKSFLSVRSENKCA